MAERSSRRRAEPAELFAVPAYPDGLRDHEDLIEPAQEAELLAAIAGLPFNEARYRSIRPNAGRSAMGPSYDFATNALLAAPTLPDFLIPLRVRVAAFAGIPPQDFAYALVTEYQPGTQLGWHRDVPSFGAVVGISLVGEARMRFRPWPHTTGAGREHGFILSLRPRSAYVLQREIRWRWQHAISPTKTMRYSIPFRTATARQFGER